MNNNDKETVLKVNIDGDNAFHGPSSFQVEKNNVGKYPLTYLPMNLKTHMAKITIINPLNQ